MPVTFHLRTDFHEKMMEEIAELREAGYYHGQSLISEYINRALELFFEYNDPDLAKILHNQYYDHPPIDMNLPEFQPGQENVELEHYIEPLELKDSVHQIGTLKHDRA